MPILSELATLVVDIQADPANANAIIDSLRPALQRAGLVSDRTTRNMRRGFNLSATAMTRAIVQARILEGTLRGMVNIGVDVAKVGAKIEDGFLFIERLQPSLQKSGFRDELTAIAQNLRGINITDLQKAAQEVGRLGLRGDDILNVGQNISMLARVSQGSAKQMANDFGKINELLNFNNAGRAALDYSNILLKLESNLVTTASAIAATSARMAGMAATADMTAGELLALSGFAEQVGRASNLNATSIIRTLRSVFNETEGMIRGFAKFGIDATDIIKTFEQDAFQGFRKFIEFLGKLNFTQQLAVFKEMQIEGVRVAPMLQNQALNVADLDKAYRLMIEALKEGTELWRQFGIVSRGLSSDIETTAEAWDIFKSKLSENKIIKDIIVDLGRIADMLTEIHESGKGFLSFDSASNFVKDYIAGVGQILDFTFGKGTSDLIKRQLRPELVEIFKGRTGEKGSITERERSKFAFNQKQLEIAKQESELNEKKGRATGLQAEMERRNQEKLNEIEEKRQEVIRKFNVREDFRNKRDALRDKLREQRTGFKQGGGVFDTEGFVRNVIKLEQQKRQDAMIKELEKQTKLQEKELRLEEELLRKFPPPARAN